MRLMGLEAIYPKPRLSGSGNDHPRFPYLLKGLAIERSKQVWCSDITYIGLAGGFVYLFALMDWFSRFVLAWELSNSLESNFCVRALRRALRKYASPQISNTDQGVQFTRRPGQTGGNRGWLFPIWSTALAKAVNSADLKPLPVPLTRGSPLAQALLRQARRLKCPGGSGMKIQVQITMQSDEGKAEVVHEVARLERGLLRPDTLGAVPGRSALDSGGAGANDGRRASR
ncbi:MAG: transposase family protein, partial [Verrucomicrobia bacterium]|nr:transposase family protein [Verrucomicrobiota bacterium]